MLMNVMKSIVRGSSSVAASVKSVAPIITSRKLDFQPLDGRERLLWVENFDTVKEERIGMINVHPEIFAVNPRIDLIHSNVHWQKMYRFVNYSHVNNRGELRGGGRKPRPQKGTGRSRHGSIRSPLWHHGGKAHGPRQFTTHFYMLPFFKRIHGLTVTLSVKLAQDDLHIIDNLDIPTTDPSFLLDLVEERKWGPSVLIVDESDVLPQNLALATDRIGHINVMPVYGLNVFSMVKHDTLVLTLAAVNRIEERLLYHLHRVDNYYANRRFKGDHV